jgi:hypothetical protein
MDCHGESSHDQVPDLVPVQQLQQIAEVLADLHLVRGYHHRPSRTRGGLAGDRRAASTYWAETCVV